MFELSSKTEGECLVVLLKGRIGGEASIEFYRRVKDCVEESSSKVVALDFEGVDFVDSSGLGSLVAIHTNMKKAGRRLCLCAVPGNLLSLLKMTNLLPILEIANSWKEMPEANPPPS